MTKADARDRDAEQIAKIASGDRRAFNALHHEQYRAVVRLAVGILGDPTEARDVAQEVFVRLLAVAPRWKPDARVSTWLYRTTLNVSLTMRRRIARWWSRTAPSPQPRLDPEQASALGQAARDIDTCLGQLSPRQRAVVTLHLDQGLSASEIASALDMTPNAARLALSKGLRSLRQHVGPAVQDLNPEKAEA